MVLSIVLCLHEHRFMYKYQVIIKLILAMFLFSAPRLAQAKWVKPYLRKSGVLVKGYMTGYPKPFKPIYKPIRSFK